MDMSTMDREDEVRAREQARRHVRGLRAFYIHATVYAAVMAMLLFINITTGDIWQGNFWAKWPAMPWGILLLIHGFFATRGADLFGRDWEDRKVEEIMRRNQGSGS